MKTRNKICNWSLLALACNILYSIKSSITVYADTLEFSIGPDGLLEIKGSGSGGITAWQEFLVTYKSLVVLLAALAALTMVILFIIGFIRLGASAGNPNARGEAIKGIIVTGIATALLGSVSLFTHLSYSALKTPNQSKNETNQLKVEIKTIENLYASINEENGVMIYEKLSSST